MAFGRELLVDVPEQLLGVVERQARQLLKQQSELNDCRQQLAALEREVETLQENQIACSAVPFRIYEEKADASIEKARSKTRLSRRMATIAAACGE